MRADIEGGVKCEISHWPVRVVERLSWVVAPLEHVFTKSRKAHKYKFEYTVRIVIHGRVSALSADQRTEDRRVWGHPNLEMGRAWLQLEGVAPTRVPCPISEGRIRGSGSDRSGSEHGETRERARARYGIVQVNI
jgi:hypothetical protein